MRKRQVFSLFMLAAILFSVIVALVALPDYFFKQGLVYFKKGDFENAYKKFVYARLWNKQNSDYREYYVRTLMKFKPTNAVQKELCEFAHDTRRDNAHVFAAIQVGSWRSNITHKYGVNYIEQAPMGDEIIRWNPKTFPLKVYVDFDKNSVYPDYYLSEITRAFKQWTDSSGFIPFVFIKTKSKADIVVNITTTPEGSCGQTGCKYIVAHTDPVIKHRILKKMIITVYDKDASGAFFSDKQIYNTVLHEIGHALGIMGHSFSTDDLMYMVNETSNPQNTFFLEYKSKFQYISVKDISTMKLLYNTVPTITNTSLSEINTENLLEPSVVLGSAQFRGTQKIKEAKHYIKEAPDLPGGYIDLAIAYESSGNLKKALDAFNQAYVRANQDNDKFIIMYDIAAMYMNHNKPEEAISYARQAQEIDNNDDIAELISNIEHSIKTKSKPFWVSRISK